MLCSRGSSARVFEDPRKIAVTRNKGSSRVPDIRSDFSPPGATERSPTISTSAKGHLLTLSPRVHLVTCTTKSLGTKMRTASGRKKHAWRRHWNRNSVMHLWFIFPEALVVPIRSVIAAGNCSLPRTTRQAMPNPFPTSQIAEPQMTSFSLKLYRHVRLVLAGVFYIPARAGSNTYWHLRRPKKILPNKNPTCQVPTLTCTPLLQLILADVCLNSLISVITSHVPQ